MTNKAYIDTYWWDVNSFETGFLIADDPEASPFLSKSAKQLHVVANSELSTESGEFVMCHTKWCMVYGYAHAAQLPRLR